MQLSKALYQALVQFLGDLPVLRTTAERERLLEMAFHQEGAIFAAISPEAETVKQYAWRLVRHLEEQRCGPGGTEWALLVYLEELHADLGEGDRAGELASYLAQLRAHEEARHLIQEAGLDPNATTLEEIIAFYFDELLYDFALTAREYVDLSGEQTTLPAWFLSRGAGRRRGRARQDLQAVLGISLGHVALDGEHCGGDEAGRQSVASVRHTLLTVARGVLLGEPGSGKSWTLRQLALDYAALWEAQREAGEPDQALVPILVELRAWGGTWEGQRCAFADFVRAEARVLGPYLERLLAEGRVVFLLDALNEMPRRSPLDGHDLVSEVRAYLQDKPRFVLSCRVRDYQDDLGALRPLEQLYLRDLTPPQIREVLRKRLGEKQGEALWQTMGGSEALLGFWQKVAEHGEEVRFWEAGQGVPSYTSGSEDTAWRRIHEGARLIPLCRNPFLSHLLCWVYMEVKGHLPSSRAELFALFITKLLEREAWYAAQRGEAWPEQAALEAALVSVARAMQEAAGTVLPWATALEAVGGTAHRWLLDAAISANLLVVEGESVRFSHQLLQEYFAARTLLEALEAGEEPMRFFGAGWWEAGVWRETTVILGEFLGEGAQGPNRVAHWLAAASPEVALQVILRHGEGLTVADLEPATHTALLTSAQARTTEPDPRGRAAAYRVLALLDADNRSGVGLRADGLPDVAWVEIPGGVCRIGGDEAAWNSLPAQEVEVPTFWLAKYPVTNWQWAAFVADGGYETDEWWEGLEKPVPAEPWWHYGNHPRETVDWYEAMAYCRWLSARLGYEVRLPSEEEWEKAARGSEGWLYPYGNEFDAAKGNTSETGIRQTSAVGIFPAGASPYGVEEMSGNVWEWCLTNVSDVSRVRRGGSWFYLAQNARAASRLHNLPVSRYFGWGFRVARSVPAVL